MSAAVETLQGQLADHGERIAKLEVRADVADETRRDVKWILRGVILILLCILGQVAYHMVFPGGAR